ncbi:hypothetical protein FPV67DRAFT_1447780 [Lyophyllum atratum]|nr:hypothetical protein FPV67DRAFT_1447780 [Lyophyllum atratum]
MSNADCAAHVKDPLMERALEHPSGLIDKLLDSTIGPRARISDLVTLHASLSWLLLPFIGLLPQLQQLETMAGRHPDEFPSVLLGPGKWTKAPRRPFRKGGLGPPRGILMLTCSSIFSDARRATDAWLRTTVFIPCVMWRRMHLDLVSLSAPRNQTSWISFLCHIPASDTETLHRLPAIPEPFCNAPNVHGLRTCRQSASGIYLCQMRRPNPLKNASLCRIIAEPTDSKYYAFEESCLDAVYLVAGWSLPKELTSCVSDRHELISTLVMEPEGAPAPLEGIWTAPAATSKRLRSIRPADQENVKKLRDPAYLQTDV